MADSAKLRKAISEILDDADLNTITAKKVRQHLEAKLQTDLTDRKKEIDEMVMEELDKKQGKSDEEEVSEDEGKKSTGKRRKQSDSESEDEFVPEKKSKKGKKADSDDDSDDWGKKQRRSAAASKKGKAKSASGDGAKKRGGTGFTKIMKLSPELSSVMGQPEMARHEVVKKMWSIIKEKKISMILKTSSLPSVMRSYYQLWVSSDFELLA